MIPAWNSLRGLGLAMTVMAFLLGASGAWLWLGSNAQWQAHLTRAEFSGRALFPSLLAQTAAPLGIDIVPLSAENQQLAARGAFGQISGGPHPALVTNVSILSAPRPGLSGHALVLAVVSADLRYPLADLSFGEGHSAAETLGALTRVLASYCSDPVLYAQMNGANWVRIDGARIWGCAAAPRDLRLVAALLSIVGLAMLLTAILNTTGHFEQFASLLRSRQRLGGPDSYDTEGPQELRNIVAAVNSYLEAERDRLEKRAMVLSGVSHDLGTPATRLRLRAALVEDADLRGRFEADIDLMTGIIDSVLTYTQAEVNSEAAQQISLSSLVESVVSDYSDTGRPVAFQSAKGPTVSGGRSVFMSRQGQSVLPDERRVVVLARPVALQRAVSNLIDNALKYGRRATVSLEADADVATIVVEDEGADYSPQDLERLIAPYKRGENTGAVQGFGLGLTIVASIANMHGGALCFERGTHGLRARLSIQRS